MRTCEVCGIDISDKKDSARTCSPKCRKDLSRLQSVTPNVTLSDSPVTLDFKFYTITKAREPLKDQAKEEDQKGAVRTAKYWYDVPLGAIPVIQKGWPAVPEFMNGRQYFLWWKNDFKMSDKSPDSPEIHNPYPERTNLTYVMGGETSRRWGA